MSPPPRFTRLLLESTSSLIPGLNPDYGYGILPGDQPGYWGPVTGFDFCERNYDTSYYVGEIGNTFTNWLSCPVYVAMVLYLWRTAPSTQITPLTWVFLFVGFFDMFNAGMSHMTLQLEWTQAQETVLTLDILFGFLIVLTRYDGDLFSKIVACFVYFLYSCGEGYNAFLDNMEMFHGEKHIGPQPFNMWNYIFVIATLCELVLLLYALCGRGDAVTRLFVGQAVFINPAFFIFGLTAVSSGMCSSLPIWLHEAGHLLGAVSDYLTLLMILSLDPELRKAGFRPGLAKGFFPFLVHDDDEEAVGWTTMAYTSMEGGFSKGAKQPLTKANYTEEAGSNVVAPQADGPEMGA